MGAMSSMTVRYASPVDYQAGKRRTVLRIHIELAHVGDGFNAIQKSYRKEIEDVTQAQASMFFESVDSLVDQIENDMLFRRKKTEEGRR
jgi:FAD synthase